VRAPSPEQVTLVLRDGRQVLWGGPVDGATKASAVLALIGMPGHVYDVSAPGVVTTR
jgi:cell division protein FtsQ